MKIAVVGLGYVGLANAVLLAQQCEVVGVDICTKKVGMVNANKSPIEDEAISDYLLNKSLNLIATDDLKSGVENADFTILALPTDYDEDTNYFDTASLDRTIELVNEFAPNTSIVIKSTVPIGYTKNIKIRFSELDVTYSPEFLREGQALHDSLHPSRIIVGGGSKKSRDFATLLEGAAVRNSTEIILTNSCEAEAIKLFSNTYLAMRVAYFNELDSFCMSNGLQSSAVVKGMSLDPRIGDLYNNPSFGYGGYCLPKDTKQLRSHYQDVPERLMSAIIDANTTRVNTLADEIMRQFPKKIGIYRLSMKAGSDNHRSSATLLLANRLRHLGAELEIFEPKLQPGNFEGHAVVNDFEKFASSCDLIAANRMSEEIKHLQDKIFTRDLFGID
jgi:UDPglucose 6-dehydrogenase